MTTSTAGVKLPTAKLPSSDNTDDATAVGDAQRPGRQRSIDERKLTVADKEANDVRKSQVNMAKNILSDFLAPQPQRPSWKQRINESARQKQLQDDGTVEVPSAENDAEATLPVIASTSTPSGGEAPPVAAEEAPAPARQSEGTSDNADGSA